MGDLQQAQVVLNDNQTQQNRKADFSNASLAGVAAMGFTPFEIPLEGVGGQYVGTPGRFPVAPAVCTAAVLAYPKNRTDTSNDLLGNHYSHPIEQYINDRPSVKQVVYQVARSCWEKVSPHDEELILAVLKKHIAFARFASTATQDQFLEAANHGLPEEQQVRVLDQAATNRALARFKRTRFTDEANGFPAVPASLEGAFKSIFTPLFFIIGVFAMLARKEGTMKLGVSELGFLRAILVFKFMYENIRRRNFTTETELTDTMNAVNGGWDIGVIEPYEKHLNARHVHAPNNIHWHSTVKNMINECGEIDVSVPLNETCTGFKDKTQVIALIAAKKNENSQAMSPVAVTSPVQQESKKPVPNRNNSQNNFQGQGFANPGKPAGAYNKFSGGIGSSPNNKGAISQQHYQAHHQNFQHHHHQQPYLQQHQGPVPVLLPPKTGKEQCIKCYNFFLQNNNNKKCPDWITEGYGPNAYNSHATANCDRFSAPSPNGERFPLGGNGPLDPNVIYFVPLRGIQN